MADQLPWFRFYTDTPNDIKIRKICNETGLSKLEVVGAWSIIMSLCSNSPVRGALYVTFQERFSNDDVTAELCCSNDKATLLVTEFIKYNMLALENEAYVLPNWDKRQYKSDNSTERVRKSRSRNVSETLQKRYSNAPRVQSTDTDTDTERVNDDDTFSANPLSVAFERASGISAHNPPKWLGAIDEMKAQGILPEDVAQAVQELRDKSFSIVGPWSIKNAAIACMGKRKNPIGRQRINGGRPKIEGV
jgi:hypothetical protein